MIAEHGLKIRTGKDMSIYMHAPGFSMALAMNIFMLKVDVMALTLSSRSGEKRHSCSHTKWKGW